MRIKAEALYDAGAPAHPPDRRPTPVTTTTTNRQLRRRRHLRMTADADTRPTTPTTATTPTDATSSTATAAGCCGRSPTGLYLIGSRARRRGQPHDGQPRRAGLPSSPSWSAVALERESVTAASRARPGAASPCPSSPAPTGTWCAASSSRSSRWSARPTGPSSPCRAIAVTEVGPDRRPVLASGRGLPRLPPDRRRGAREPHALHR